MESGGIIKVPLFVFRKGHPIYTEIILCLSMCVPSIGGGSITLSEIPECSSFVKQVSYCGTVVSNAFEDFPNNFDRSLNVSK